MRISSYLLAFAMLFAFSAQADAHPGHGVDGGSHLPSHYMTDPAHLALIGITVLAIASIAFWKVVKASRWKANA